MENEYQSKIQNAQKRLETYMMHLHIRTVFLDSQENKLCIELVKPTKEIKNQILEIVGDSDLYYIVEREEYLITFDPIQESSKVSNQLKSIGSGPFYMRDGGKIVANNLPLSLTCGVLKMDGSNGVLTANHYPNLYQVPFYYEEGGQQYYIGKATQVSNTNEWDFAYIARENQDAHMFGASLDGTQCAGIAYGAAVNQEIWMNGSVTYSARGNVISNNASGIFNYPDGRSFQMNDLILTTCGADHGDSGGPAFISSEGTIYLVGSVLGGVPYEKCYFIKLYKILQHINGSLFKF